MEVLVLLLLWFSSIPLASSQIQEQCGYPNLTQRDPGLEAVPTGAAGLEGWNVVPQSFVNTAWGESSFPYVAFDLTQVDVALSSYAAQAIAIFAIVGIGFFLAVTSIICCCVICCCWCCCCCYNDDDDDDRRSKRDKRNTLIATFIVLLVIVVVLLILVFVGAVIGFVANSGVRTSFDNFPSTLTSTVTGIRDYLDNINQDVSFVFVESINSSVHCLQNESTNVEELLRQVLDSSTGILTNIGNLSTGLDDLEGQLTAAVNSLNDISLTLGQLDMLSSSINASLNTLTQAAATGVMVPTGDSLVTLVGTLNVAADPSSLLQDITAANTSIQENTRDPLNQFTSAFDKHIMEIEMNTNSVLNSISSNTELAANISNTLSSGITFITDFLSVLLNTTDTVFTGTLVPSQPLLTYSTLSDVWYWLGVFFLVLVLLAVVLTTIGLIVGGIPYTCPRVSKRKTVSNCGSRLMLIAIGSILLYTCLLLLAAAITFFVGANLQEICEPIRDEEVFAQTVDDEDWRRSNLRVILSSLTSGSSELEDLLLATVNADVSFAQALRSCQENEPIWRAFNLEQLLMSPNLPQSGPLQRVDIPDILNMVESAINGSRGSVAMTLAMVLENLDANISMNTGVTLMSGLDLENIPGYVTGALGAADTVRNESSSLLQQLEELRSNFTSSSQQSLASMTQDIIDLLQMFEMQQTTLTNHLLALNASNNQYNALLTSVNGSIQEFNQARANTNLQDNSSETHLAVLGAVSSVIDVVARYPDYVLSTLTGEIGRCFPLWAGYNNLGNTICFDFVSYINAFWFSLGWCAFWFFWMIIPLIIFGIIFQKPIEYSSSRSNDGIELMKKQRESWSWEHANSLGNPLLQYPPPQIVVLQQPADTAIGGSVLQNPATVISLSAASQVQQTKAPFEKTRKRSLPGIPPEEEVYDEVSDKPFERTTDRLSNRPLPDMPWETSQKPPVSPQPGAGNRLEVKPVGNGTLNKQQQPPPLPSREETNDEYQPFSFGPLPKSENPPKVEKPATETGEEKSTEESESDYQPFSWDNNTTVDKDEKAPLISSSKNSQKSNVSKEGESQQPADNSAEIIENVNAGEVEEGGRSNSVKSTKSSGTQELTHATETSGEPKEEEESTTIDESTADKDEEAPLISSGKNSQMSNVSKEGESQEPADNSRSAKVIGNVNTGEVEEGGRSNSVKSTKSSGTQELTHATETSGKPKEEELTNVDESPENDEEEDGGIMTFDDVDSD